MINLLLIISLVLPQCPDCYHFENLYRQPLPFIRFQSDLMLYKYSGNSPDPSLISNMNKIHNTKRSICYPDSHCIILCSKQEYEQIKKNHPNILMLSPEFK